MAAPFPRKYLEEGFVLDAVTVAASVVRKKSKKKKQLISIHVE